MLNLKNTDSVRDREKQLLQRKAKLESDLARVRKAAKDADRRDDTRRKIIIGAALLRAIEEGKIPPTVGKLLQTLMTDRDRKLFDDFVFKMPETAAALDAQRE